MDGQDWDTVVVRKKKETKSGSKAKASGGSVAKKYGAGGNKQREGPSARKVEAMADAEETPRKTKEVNPDLKNLIRDARLAKGFNTQKKLANAAGVSASVVQAIEQGKMPNPADLTKIQRVLGTKFKKNK